MNNKRYIIQIINYFTRDHINDFDRNYNFKANMNLNRVKYIHLAQYVAIERLL